LDPAVSVPPVVFLLCMLIIMHLDALQ